jgi:hypothetical protein
MSARRRTGEVRRAVYITNIRRGGPLTICGHLELFFRRQRKIPLELVPFNAKRIDLIQHSSRRALAEAVGTRISLVHPEAFLD